MDRAPRVASLVPAGTEWMIALGLHDRLVGATDACPPGHGARIVLRSALDAGMTPARIDARVAASIRDGRALHMIDLDELRAARPDVLLAQALCDVCGASHAELARARELATPDARVATLAPVRLADALLDALVVADAVGAPERGESLAAALVARIDAVARAVADAPRPRVAVLEWTDPPMRCGHWFPDAIAAAGGDEVLGRPGARSAPCTWEDVADVRPDVILVAPCGLPLAQATESAREVAARFPAARVLAIDAARYLSSSGPSLVAAVEMIAHALHPNRVANDTDPTGWAEAAHHG